MDIHKPKPFHRFREFLKEYGIIVLGVLTALGCEQAAEALHWHEEVQTERKALLSEVRDNLDAIQSRMLIQPCMDKRLAELKIVLDRHAHNQPLGLAGPVGVPQAFGGTKGSWSIAVSGQGLTHIPYDEQVALSNAFGNYENWDAIRRDERVAWVKLGTLDDADGLSDSDWALLRQAYAQARAATHRVADVGPFVLKTASMGQNLSDGTPQEKDMRLRAKASQISGEDTCRPLLAP